VEKRIKQSKKKKKTIFNQIIIYLVYYMYVHLPILQEEAMSNTLMHFQK